MELVAPDIHEFARRRVTSRINCTRNGLKGQPVQQPVQQKSRKEQTAYGQQSEETLFDRPTWAWRSGGSVFPTVDSLCHHYVSFSREEHEREGHTLFMQPQKTGLLRLLRLLRLFQGKPGAPKKCDALKHLLPLTSTGSSRRPAVSLEIESLDDEPETQHHFKESTRD